MGFSISSPSFESLAGRMKPVDPVAAYHRAAARVGQELEGHVASAFREADASDELIDTVGTYIHPHGAAYVGIPAGSPHAATARDIEYGTPYIPPRSPVRNAVAANEQELKRQMTDALDEEMGVELAGGPNA